ncbi:MAG: ankyrin repeat domain-containing protein [Candidatus Paceibacterota bacterium]
MEYSDKKKYISILIIVVLVAASIAGFYFVRKKLTIERQKIELFEAVKNSDLAMTQELIKKGADVNIKDYHNQSILVYSLSPDITKALIDGGADVNANSGGITPLIAASLFGRLNIVRELINNGADIDEKDSDHGQTALISASIFGQLDVVRELIKNGSNLESMDYSGHTALMWACEEGNIDVVKALIDGGADVNTKNDFGSTALNYASGGGDRAGYPEIIKFLRDSGAE